MEHLEKKLDELVLVVKELRLLQIEQMKQDAVDHHILKEHERRSLLLEERMKPLEEDLTFRARFNLWLLGGGGLIGGMALLVSLYRVYSAH